MNRTARKYEYLLSGVFFATLVFGMLMILGTINSGYHLIDDHEFYRYRETISESGLWDAVRINIKGDLAIRFRPLYIILRTIGVAIFGTNTILWSICKAIEIIAALQIFYIFARKEMNAFFSAVFAVLIMWGSQSEIWWRLGPQESFGMLLFAAALLATYRLRIQNVWYNKLSFVILLTLLSLQKESFWVSIPWFVLLLFAYECKESDDEKLLFFIKNFIKRHFAEILSIIIVFAINLYMILFVVGTDKVSYAGYSADLSWKFYVLQTLNNLTGECAPYLLSLVTVIMISYIGYQKRLLDIGCILQMCSCLYLFLAELVIYAKSGMESRYILPWAVSILYVIFILGYRFWTENPRMKITIGGLSLFFIFLMAKEVVPEGIKFAEKGRNLQACVDYVIGNTSETDKVVAISRDEEIDYAFGVLMQHQYQYLNFSEIEEYESDLSQLLEADILFGKTGQINYRLTEEAGLLLDNYDFYETKYYEVALKR